MVNRRMCLRCDDRPVPGTSAPAATQFRAVGSGKYEPILGTGIWKDVVDAVSCRVLADQGDDHKLSFQVWGIHLNAFPDGRIKSGVGALRPEVLLEFNAVAVIP